MVMVLQGRDSWLIDRPETDLSSGSGVWGVVLRRQDCFSAAVSVKATRALCLLTRSTVSPLNPSLHARGQSKVNSDGIVLGVCRWACRLSLSITD